MKWLHIANTVEFSEKQTNNRTIERKEEKPEATLDWFNQNSETILNSCKKNQRVHNKMYRSNNKKLKKKQCGCKKPMIAFLLKLKTIYLILRSIKRNNNNSIQSPK